MPTTYEYVKGATDLSLVGTYSPGVVPVTGDSLNFSAGSGTITTNMSALTGAVLVNLQTKPGFTAQIGDSGNPMAVDVSGTATLSGGSARCYFSGGTGGTWATTIIQPTRSCEFQFVNITMTTMYVFGGTVRITGTAIVDAITVIGGASITIEEHGSDTIGNVQLQNGARMLARRRIAGTVNVGAGCTLEYDVDTTTTTGVITMNSDSSVIIRKGSATVTGVGGTLDYSMLEKNGYTLTVTETEGLTEKAGGVPFTTYTRTQIGKGSKKITV